MGEETEEEEQGGGKELMKEGVLVLSGSPHTSGESWSWRPRGLRGRLQLGGEEEEPRNS